jgi:hypothetical protein
VYQKVGEIDASAGSLNDASGNGTWDSVKAGYLNQVEKALASAGHREKKQVLEDVRSHLDQRFSELGADEQTWENMQAAGQTNRCFDFQVSKNICFDSDLCRCSLLVWCTEI